MSEYLAKANEQGDYTAEFQRVVTHSGFHLCTTGIHIAIISINSKGESESSYWSMPMSLVLSYETLYYF